jgi:hypothetical protein
MTVLLIGYYARSNHSIMFSIDQECTEDEFHPRLGVLIQKEKRDLQTIHPSQVFWTHHSVAALAESVL